MKRSKFQVLIDMIRGKIPSIKKVKKDNSIQISTKHLKRCILDVRGKDNLIKIDDSASISGRIYIKVFGDNNKIEIKERVAVNSDLSIKIGQNHSNYGKVKNSEFIIGKLSKITSLDYKTLNSNAKCIIGEDCLFSFNITIYNTDAHPVYDLNTCKIINKVKDIIIGNHCWIGANSTILKNVVIADDCILGWGSVASGKYEKQHCAIAGNPAKIIKENITWSRDAGEAYISNI